MSTMMQDWQCILNVKLTLNVLKVRIQNKETGRFGGNLL